VLGSLPVLLLIPTVAALVGSAWAASHPAEVVHRGLVVHEATFGDSLATALIGGLVGLFLLVAAVFVFVLIRYRLIGDRTWRVSWEMIYRERGSVVSTRSSVSMECKVTPPVLLSALGHVEAVTRYPDGTLLERGQEAMRSTEYGIGFAPTGGGRPQTGTYEIRWYGTSGTRRLREIARSRYTFHG
jgi:hypothetical protein